MTVLLVDDDEDFRHGLAENLRDDGYLVREYQAASSVPVTEIAEVHVAITDYLMPGENGMTFAQRFHDANPRVPVILVTAYSTPEMEKTAAELGYISLLHKPVGYEKLQALLTNLLDAGH